MTKGGVKALRKLRLSNGAIPVLVEVFERLSHADAVLSPSSADGGSWGNRGQSDADGGRPGWPKPLSKTTGARNPFFNV
eukprot:scaffold108671_cov27-Tisochrysis_lutea.AAC.4